MTFRKLTLFVLSFLLFVSVASSATTAAVTPTPTVPASPTEQDIDQIERIKDLVASKVAELKLVDKRGIIATVKSLSSTQISATDIRGQQRMIDIDELTKFSSSPKTSFGISDIKSGNVLSIVGLYNKDTKRLLARFISIASDVPENIEGVITKKNAIDFTLNIITSAGKQITVNVESLTKTSLYQDGETVKSGFSKITTGERVIVVGFYDKSLKEQLNASRIIRFPDIPISAGLKKALDDANSQPAPVSTGSAGKIQPLKK